MAKINAAITGVAGFLPEYRLTNDELSKMVDTNNEWIMTRIGIEERRILKGEGKGTSDMATPAVLDLLNKTNTSPDDIDLVICATVTPDMPFPSTANVICEKVGIKNAFGFDINAACSGFLYALVTASKYIETGTCKKVLVIGADKMSSIVDYTNRNTCPLFGDAGAAVLLGPTTEELGVLDSILGSDPTGRKHLHQIAGGSCYPASHDTVDARQHYIYQEGQAVFKAAVTKMADVSLELVKRNNLAVSDIHWLVPHQANLRIIDAATNRLGLPKDKVMINIEKYGNTTAATIPICLWEWESKLKKNDVLILTAFGAGFTWASVYLKWAY